MPDGDRWIPILSTGCQVHVGACGHLLSCQTLNATTSRISSSGGACPVLKSPWA
jgi:hypothetical protein